jgi:hypothetical protein
MKAMTRLTGSKNANSGFHCKLGVGEMSESNIGFQILAARGRLGNSE